jgi:hypothetical protein
LIFSVSLFSQQTNTLSKELTDTTAMMSVIVQFDEANMATKDGYDIGEYIVNISFAQAKLLDGKTIKISGHFTIVEGLENKEKLYDEDGNELFKQGRLGDTKHIESPIFEIISE